MAAEFGWLVWWRSWRGSDAGLLLLPGALMLLALRAALTEMEWGWIAAALALSFPLHLADVARRRGARERSGK